MCSRGRASTRAADRALQGLVPERLRLAFQTGWRGAECGRAPWSRAGVRGRGSLEVPALDDPGLAPPAEDADGCRGEREHAAVGWSQADPAGGEDPEEVT